MLLTDAERKQILQYLHLQLDSNEQLLTQMIGMKLPELLLKTYRNKIIGYTIVIADIENVEQVTIT